MKLVGLVAALCFVPMLAHAQGCKVDPIAQIPITLVNNARPMAPVKINGQDEVMIVDSGAFFSFLDTESAARLGVTLGNPPPGMRVRNVTGRVEYRLGRARTFSLSGVDYRNVDFMVAERHTRNEEVGLLGQNVLGVAEAEYDLKNRVIRLFRTKGCRGANLAYWAQGKPVGVVEINEVSPLSPHFEGRATIDGQPVRVMFDTGAPRSVMTLEFARKLGFRPDAPGVIKGGEAGGSLNARRVPSWIAPFKSFAIGGEEIRNTRLRVADYQLGTGDMLLGLDFFLSHRIFFSPTNGKMYFTHNGGPVFLLDQAPVEVDADAEAAPTPK